MTGTVAQGQGQDLSFEEFYASEHGRVVRLATRLGGPDRSEDLAAEAFLRLYRRWDEVDDPGAYVAQTVRRLVIDEARRRQTATRHAPAQAVPERGWRQVEDDVTTSRQLNAALARLAPQQRRAVVLRYWCDLPETEVAAVLGVSVGTVKSSASRGIAVLRREVPCCPTL